MPRLLTVSDVLGTGQHAAVVAEVGPGKTVAVVGDGAVGLLRACIAAKQLGAEQIIIMSRHETGSAWRASSAPPTSSPSAATAASSAIKELTDGLGAHSVVECVGTEQSMRPRSAIARPGGARRARRRPALRRRSRGAQRRSSSNVTVGGGPAPVRAYIDELLPDVLEGRIEPGRVFDRTVASTASPTATARWTERESIKVLVRP